MLFLSYKKLIEAAITIICFAKDASDDQINTLILNIF